MDTEEDIHQLIREMTEALESVSTERDLYKKMYETEKQAKESMAVELESALVRIARLNFYLENS